MSKENKDVGSDLPVDSALAVLALPESAPTQPYEVIHYPSFDIIIKNSADRADIAFKLAEVFKDGLPEGWEKFTLPPEENPEHPDYDEWDSEYRGPKLGSARGELNGVKLFYKPKIHTGDYAKEHLDHIQKNGDASDRKFFNRLNSVLNEIVNAPSLKKIIGSPDAQRIVQKYGYRGIKYLEPLIAVVNRQTGEKALVYELVEGKNLASEIQSMSMVEFHKLHEMEEELELFVRGQGVDPINDFGYEQMLEDEDKNLYLIDAETYTLS